MSTHAYVDLMFAWGHARLGDEGTARRLLAGATESLRSSGDRAHAWLLDAFTYRIEQAIAGQPHAGPLPPALLDANMALATDWRTLNLRYVADRVRHSSRILEPDEQVDPYRPWRELGPPKPHPLDALLGQGPPGPVMERYEELRREAEAPGDPFAAGRFISEMLRLRGPVAELLVDRILSAAEADIAGHLTHRWADHPKAADWFKRHRSKPDLNGSKEVWDRYHAEAANPGPWVESTIYGARKHLFEAAVEFVEAAGPIDGMHRLTERFLALQLGPDVPAAAKSGFGAVAEKLAQTILQLGLRESATVLCNRLPVNRLFADMEGGPEEPMLACLRTARLNHWLGRVDPARWALPRTLERLPQIKHPAIQTRAVGGYIELSACFAWTECASRLRDLLDVLPRTANSYTTATHFSRLHLLIAERFVLAIAGEDFRPAAELHAFTPPAEIADRREALADARRKLVEWGQPDWAPVQSP